MQTRVTCRHCQTKLLIKAELAGQQIACPRCLSPVFVTVAAGMMARAAEPMRAQSSSPEPAKAAKPEVIEAVLLPDNPDSSTDESRDTQPSKSDLCDTSETKAKPKRRKKKRRGVKAETHIPVWLWIVGCAGALVAVGGVFFGIYLALTVSDVHREGVDWVALLLQFVIGMPVSLIILFASVYIASALGVGIDFGDVKTAVTGGLFLIFIVNLVALIPFGIWFTLIAWLAGLMTIFGLYWWEAWILWLINVVLNVIAYFILVGMLNAVTAPEDDNKPEKQREEEIKKDRRDPNWKERDPQENPGNDDRGLVLNDAHELMRVWIQKQII